MYQLIVTRKHQHLNYSAKGLTSLDMDIYLTLEGFDLVEEAVRNIMIQPCDPYDPELDDLDVDNYIMPEQEDCRVVRQYIENVLSLIIGCVREFGAVQINLNTLSISNKIDPSVETSITFIKE